MPENNQEEIKLKEGRSAIIKLKGLATAGYEWNYLIDKNKDIVEVSKDYESIPGNKAGYSADEKFTITAKKAGTVIIHFTQKKSWEKNTEALNEKKIKIVIE